MFSLVLRNCLGKPLTGGLLDCNLRAIEPVDHPERKRGCNVPAFPTGNWEICLRRWSFMERYTKKKNSEDSSDVINVPTRVACVVQEHAKGTKL